VHPKNQTPSTAVLYVGLGTAALMFLGGAILVPISEVGSAASAIGWLAACAAYYRIERGPAARTYAIAGVVVASLLALMKFVPFVPGHFSAHEYIALAVWCLGGLLLRSRGRASG